MRSFSAEVKKELSEMNSLSNKELVKAELKGYFLTNSSKDFSTSNQYNINRYSKLLNNIGENDFTITIKGNNFQVKKKKRVNIDQDINTDEQKRALIRGTFLGTGSITNPEKVYHLEIVFEEEKNAKYIYNLLSKFEINSKIIGRESKYVLYITDGEGISNFLALIGASNSVLKFEEKRVIKDIRNNINRMVNYETANLNKTINSSIKQIESIKYIKSKKKLNELSSKELQLAELRLKNPNASLIELAKLSNPVISKSGANHRMNNIMQFAEKLKEKNNNQSRK